MVSSNYHQIQEINAAPQPQPSFFDPAKKLISDIAQWWDERNIVSQITAEGFRGCVILNDKGNKYQVYIPRAISDGLRAGTESLKSIVYVHYVALKCFANACVQADITEASRLINKYQFVVDSGKVVLKNEKRWLSPLARACKEGEPTVVEMLLNAKVDPNEQVQTYLQDPLLLACFSNRKDKLRVIALLINAKVDLTRNIGNLNNPILNTLFYHQILYRQTSSINKFSETVQLLIKAGAKVDAPFLKPLDTLSIGKVNIADLAVELEEEDLLTAIVLAGGDVTRDNFFPNSVIRGRYDKLKQQLAAPSKL